MTDPMFAPEKEFGQTYNGKYHMPLLPGEKGTKSGGDWVPYGIKRATNLAGALEDTRALNVWEQGMGLIGLALAPDLYAELVALVGRAAADGVDFELLRNYPELKEALAGVPHDDKKINASIIGRAKKIAGGSAAAERGIADHDAWEHRAKTGDLSGTARSRGQVTRAEALLADAGLVRVPGLSERVVRNVALNVCGKFDDVLMEESTGRLLIADLKTKATKFYSRTAVDIQLAVYARSEWMLADSMSHDGLFQAGEWYEPGPLHHVDQTEGVILHVPSDGAPARLERADLMEGWKDALLAKQVMERRSSGRSAERFRRSVWVATLPASLSETSPKNLASAS